MQRGIENMLFPHTDYAYKQPQLFGEMDNKIN